MIVLAGYALAGVAAATEYQGQVTFGGLPLPGAMVIVKQGETQLLTSTDQRGFYSFFDLRDGTWTLEIQMTGFASLKQDVAIGRNTPAGKWAFKLLPLAEMKARTGTAVGAESRAPGHGGESGPSQAPPSTPSKPDGESSGAGLKLGNKNDEAGPTPTTVEAEDLSQRANIGYLINGSHDQWRRLQTQYLPYFLLGAQFPQVFQAPASRVQHPHQPLHEDVRRIHPSQLRPRPARGPLSPITPPPAPVLPRPPKLVNPSELLYNLIGRINCGRPASIVHPPGVRLGFFAKSLYRTSREGDRLPRSRDSTTWWISTPNGVAPSSTSVRDTVLPDLMRSRPLSNPSLPDFSTPETSALTWPISATRASGGKWHSSCP